MAALSRRRLLQSSILTGALAGCATRVAGLPPLRARTDRIFDMTVCLRPFRAAGPRLDVEQVGDAMVVHNYGHGGSGWSLSWGSSTIAVRRAMAGSPREIAVIGCGALGLTSAILAQRAGAAVTIYAREEIGQTRSARATGTWTPDSRIALRGAAGPAFGAVWEEMARTSFKAYRGYLGLPGQPVEWIDRYTLSDVSRDDPAYFRDVPGSLDFASYGDRIADLTPRPTLVPRGGSPFNAPYVYQGEALMFNIANYSHTLMGDFLQAGGRIVHADFHTPVEVAALPQKVVINCTGYGARALWRDESVVPVRGQIGWLIPQPELRYALLYRDVFVLPRRDGIVVQAVEGGDMKGYGNDQEVVDRAETERAVGVIRKLFDRQAFDRAKTIWSMRWG